MPRKKSGLTLNCEICKNEFYVPKSRLKFGNPRFCSVKCKYKWFKGVELAEYIDTACQTCGKNIHILKSRYADGKHGRYCSQKCMIADRPKPKRIKKSIVNCQLCGKEFEIYPSWLKKGDGKFCSRKCVISNTNRQMRLNGQTTIEKLLQDELNKRNIDHSYNYSLPPWVIDFAFPNYKLAVEADGIYWHSLDNVKEKDKRKDKDLIKRGWTILHFTGDEIRNSPFDCVDKIVSHLHK